MDTKTVKLKKIKDTKHMRVFGEATTGKPPLVKSIYLPLWYVGGTTEIELTVSEVK